MSLYDRVGKADGPGPGPREVSSWTRLAAPVRLPGPTSDHPFQSPGLDLCRLVDDPRRIADRDPSLLHCQRTAGAAGLSSDSTLAAWATVLLLTRNSAAASPWVKELRKFAPFSFRGRPGADHAESLWGSPQWPPSSVPAREWKQPSPARGAALRMFLVGCPRPARSAPPVKPSAQPFSRLRVPRTEHALSNLEPIWPQRLPASPPPMPDPRRCL